MKCYICEKQPKTGGTNFHVRAAVGICHNCGIAVCLEHSHKAAEPGSPLLCPGCAELLCQEETKHSVNLAVMQENYVCHVATKETVPVVGVNHLKKR